MALFAAPAGAYRNRDAYSPRMQIAQSVDDGLEILLFDPQTSGGLLVAVDPAEAGRFEKELENRNSSTTPIGLFNKTGQIAVTP